MDDRVARIKTAEDCEKFAKNADRLGRPDLVAEARAHAVKLKAQAYGETAGAVLAASDVEQECIEAIFAYEQQLTRKNGRKTRATYTWQMVKRHGIVEATERAVGRESTVEGYQTLTSMGLKDFAFEAVILRHPDVFSDEGVVRSKERMAEWAEAG